MPIELHKSTVRASLTPRREPYWGPPYETGRYLGYRKLEQGGTWIARLRDDGGTQHYLQVTAGAPAPRMPKPRGGTGNSQAKLE